MLNLSLQSKIFILLIFVFLGLFLLTKTSEGTATVIFDSCPKTIDTTSIRLKGIIMGGWTERPCPFGAPCPVYFDQYPVSEVWYSFVDSRGSSLNVPGFIWRERQQAIDGDCWDRNFCEGWTWIGYFDTGTIRNLEDGETYTLTVYARAKTRGSASCTFQVKLPNTAPSIQLQEPPHNVWINYTPHFRAKIWDDDFPAY